MLHSLRARIILVVLLTTLSAVVVALVAMVAYDIHIWRKDGISEIRTQADLLGQTIAPALSFGDRKSAQENLNLLRSRPEIRAAAVYAADGALFASYSQAAGVAQVPATAQAGPEQINGGELLVFERVALGPETLGTVHLRASHDLDSRLLSYAGISLAVAAFSMLVALLFSFRLQRIVTRPILSISRLARQVVQQHDYSRRAEKLSTDEVGTLVDSFNDMMAEIERHSRENSESLKRVAHARQQILELNEDLERRVDERTTQLMQSNEELARAIETADKANRAKSDFISSMSHELRTPLNAMIGFAQLLGLDRSPRLAAHQDEWTQQIQRAGWHLLEMINETLDLARIESGSVQLTVGPLALQPLVGACCAMLATPAAQRGIRIEQAVAADAGAVLGDALRFKQVLTNLLSNAVKYNVPQGHVVVVARRLESDDGDVIEITVSDTGLGMSPEQQAALFQPYNRLGREKTDIEGTGIGLVISRRLAELMGGTLEATSTAGKGSVFTLRLPAAELEQAPPVPFTHTSPAPYHRRLVHYVEDNETNVEVMRGIFAQRPQIRLEVSMLGLDGLTAIRASRPDLVLLDMQLPDISGLELLRHLKQDDSIADIPVVVVSADATALQTQRALTSGALRYVTKPVDVTQLLQIVDDVLEAADTRWS